MMKLLQNADSAPRVSLKDRDVHPTFIGQNYLSSRAGLTFFRQSVKLTLV
jgi:hypothetical protein